MSQYKVVDYSLMTSSWASC